MKNFALSEDLRTDLVTYINHSKSEFTTAQVNGILELLKTLPEINIIAPEATQVEIPVVTPEVMPDESAQ